MEKLTIKTSEWQRGRIGSEGNRVLWLKETNSGCCLGHFCHKLRDIPLEKLEMQCYPSVLGLHIDKLTSESNLRHTFLSSSAMSINDDEDINDSVRMNKLRELFKKADVELEFIVDSDLY